MKKLAAVLLLLIPVMASAQSQAPPVLLVDNNGLPYPSGTGTPPASTAPPMTCVTNVSGNMQYCNFSGGGGGGGSVTAVQIEHVFSAAGSFSFAHNLNSVFPLVGCITRTGANWGSATWTYAPDNATNPATNTLVTVPAAGDYYCTFSASTTADFLVGTNPTSQTFWPTMTGTQQPTFTVNQTAVAGYSGTVTYSTSSLAGGMSSGFSPTTISGTGTSNLTLSFPANQASGTTTFNVSGTDGTKTHATTPSITIGNINSGLVDCWLQTDGGSSTTFADSCGTSNTETKQTGTFTWASNPPLGGSTATFSATAYTTGANQTATNFNGSTPFSFSTWVKFSDVSTFRTVLSTLDPAASFIGWELGTSPSKFNVWISNALSSNGIQIDGSTTLAANTLYWVVVTYDGSKTAAGTKIYVNGVLEASTVANNNLTGTIANTKTLAMGARPDGSTPLGGGIIAYTRIYNRVLSATDVANYYALGAR